MTAVTASTTRATRVSCGRRPTIRIGAAGSCITLGEYPLWRDLNPERVQASIDPGRLALPDRDHL